MVNNYLVGKYAIELDGVTETWQANQGAETLPSIKAAFAQPQGSFVLWAIVDGVRRHIVITWDHGEGGLWIDGQDKTSSAIEHLAIIDRAITGEEIRAIYESGAPVFAKTTFQFNRR